MKSSISNTVTENLIHVAKIFSVGELRVDPITVGSIMMLYNISARQLEEGTDFDTLKYVCHSIVGNMIEDQTKPDSFYFDRVPGLNFLSLREQVYEVTDAEVLFKSVIWFLTNLDINTNTRLYAFRIGFALLVSPLTYYENQEELANGIIEYIEDTDCKSVVTGKIHLILETLEASGHLLHADKLSQVIKAHSNGSCEVEALVSMVSDVVKNPKTPIKSLNNPQIIGSGSYGNIYKIIMPNGEPAAVKYQKKDLALAAMEIGFLKYLEHSNVVGLRFFHFDLHSIFFGMEYAPKGSLRDCIDRSVKFEHSKAIGGILKGLKYLHNTANLIHNDIKPDNILLFEDGEAKIADFGLSVALLTFNDIQFRGMKGTPFYSPLSILEDIASFAERSKYGYRRDIWAAGITIIEIITGDYPFNFMVSDLEDLIDNIQLKLGTGRYNGKSLIPGSIYSDLTVKMLNYQEELRPTGEESFEIFTRIPQNI